MIEVITLLLIPLAAALLLVHVRRKFGVRWFVGTSLLLLAAASSLPFFNPEVVFYNSGRPASFGFETWVLPCAMGCIVLICAPVFSQKWLRVGQVVVAVLAEILWVSYAAWVA